MKPIKGYTVGELGLKRKAPIMEVFREIESLKRKLQALIDTPADEMLGKKEDEIQG